MVCIYMIHNYNKSVVEPVNINDLPKTEAKYSYKTIFSCKKEFQVIVREVLKESVNFVMFIFLLLWLISAIFFLEFTAFKRVSLMHVCSHHHHTPSPQSMNNLAGKIVTTQT